MNKYKDILTFGQIKKLNNMENIVEDYIEEHIEYIETSFLHSESVLRYITGKFMMKFPRHFNLKKLAVTHTHLFTDEDILSNPDLFPTIPSHGRSIEFRVKMLEASVNKNGDRSLITIINNGIFQDITKNIFEKMKALASETSIKYKLICDKAMISWAKRCIDLDTDFVKKHFSKDLWIQFASHQNVSEDIFLNNDFSDAQIKNILTTVKNKHLPKLLKYAIENNIFNKKLYVGKRQEGREFSNLISVGYYKHLLAERRVNEQMFED